MTRQMTVASLAQAARLRVEDVVLALKESGLLCHRVDTGRTTLVGAAARGAAVDGAELIVITRAQIVAVRRLRCTLDFRSCTADTIVILL